MAVYVSNYSATQQQVSWDSPGGIYQTTQIQRSTNGGGYVTVPINGMAWFPVSIRLVRITCAPGSSYRYRIQHRWLYQGVGPQQMYSDYYYSSTLTFQPPGGGEAPPPDPEPPEPPPPEWTRPTNLRVTALSDTSISLAWQNNSPYLALELNTIVNGVSQPARQLASGSETTFTDTLYPKANRLLYYYLIATISSYPGDVAYSFWIEIRTTPAAPLSAVAARHGLGIKVSWGRPANWDHTWQWLDVDRWDNVSGWVTWARGLSQADTSLEDYDVSRSKQYRYRIRARANSGSFERISGWAYTDYIRLLSLPVNIGGMWKDLDGAWVNVGGQYRDVDGAWVNVGGVWVPA